MTTLAARSRRLRPAGLYLFVLLASVAVQGVAAEDDSRVAATVTLLTYNVQHHTDTFVDDLKSLLWGTPPPTARIAPALDLLSREKADIIALQEVTPVLLGAIRQHAGLKAYYVTSTLPPVANGWQRHLATAVRYLFGHQPWGQAILSRWPATEVRIYPIGRPLLVVGIDSDQLALTIATCHLDSFAENHDKRIRQLRQAFHHLVSARHALLLGDFNFGDQAPENVALPGAYVDAWRHLHADNPGYTHPAIKARHPRETTRRRLDRILLRSQALVPVRVERIGTEAAEHSGGALYLSDHYGVMAELLVTGA